jgi:hypothetical protein
VTLLKELSKYKLELMGQQEVRSDGGGTEVARKFIFFYRTGNETHELGTVLFVHKRIIRVKKIIILYL